MQNVISNKKKQLLCNPLKCTGCGACENACPKQSITMVRNEQGFDYPQIDDSFCIGCGICGNVCPQSQHTDLLPINAEVYAATMKGDEEVLKKSSSGGMGYILAKKIIEEGGVVFGAEYTEQNEVRHRSVETEEELCKLQGSKYVQSKTQKCYQETVDYLKKGRKVLYFGMPCQIDGLKAYVRRMEVSTETLYTIDILCGGIPSPGVFETYIAYLRGKYNNKFKELNFRSKRYGYGYGYLHQAILLNGKEKILTGKDAGFVKTLGAGYIRNSCFDCRFASINRIGDISIGDFWGVDVPQEQWDKGVSLVFSNTEKGAILLKKAETLIKCEKKSIEEAKESQSCALEKKKKKPTDYDAFFADWKGLTWGKLYKKYLRSDSFVGKIKEEILPPWFLVIMKRLKRNGRT